MKRNNYSRRVSFRIAEATDYAVNRSTAIYQDTGKPIPDFTGSGVFLRLGPAHFLITAAHVLDWRRAGALYAGGTTLLELAGRYFITKVPEGGSRSDDRIDLVVFPLMKQQIQQLGETEWVDEQSIDVTTVSPYYVLAGFAKSQQPRRPPTPQLVANPLYLAAKKMPETAYAEVGLDPQISLLVEYQKDSSTSEGPVIAPDPLGISGGGAWAVPNLLDPEEPLTPKLAAILIAWRRMDDMVVTSRISMILDLIWREAPETRSVIAQIHGAT